MYIPVKSDEKKFPGFPMISNPGLKSKLHKWWIKESSLLILNGLVIKSKSQWILTWFIDLFGNDPMNARFIKTSCSISWSGCFKCNSGISGEKPVLDHKCLIGRSFELVRTEKLTCMFWHFNVKCEITSKTNEKTDFVIVYTHEVSIKLDLITTSLWENIYSFENTNTKCMPI